MIRRALSLVPVALLTGGCVTRAWTPSDLMTRGTPAEPPSRLVELPRQEDAMARWQLPPATTWARYEKLTLLAALDQAPRAASLPDVERLPEVQAARRAASVTAPRLTGSTMWIVDLRGAASVAFGATLSQLSPMAVAPIPTFNNWPAEEELVPAEETLAALVTMAPAPLRADSARAQPVFLLDAWRLAYRDEEVEDEVTDNRYMLGPADFPAPTELRSEGITRVVYVVESMGEEAHEEDDLHATLLAYQRAGIPITLVDLAWLASMDDAPIQDDPSLDERLAARVYAVEPRETIVYDRAFYMRARGGFGGAHGVPSYGGTVFVHGGGWGGWHGGG